MKTDGEGNPEWFRYYKYHPPGDTTQENGYNISFGDGEVTFFDGKQLPEGDYILLGQTRIGGDEFIYLLTVDPSGNKIWEDIFGPEHQANGDQYAGHAFEITGDRGYIITGYYHDDEPRGRSLILVKVGRDGRVQWEKQYGSRLFEIGEDLLVTPDGGYLVVGSAADDVQHSASGIYLLKTDPGGKVEWERVLKPHLIADGYVLAFTRDGGYLVAGTVKPEGGTHQMYLAKINATGTVEFDTSYPMGNIAVARSVLETPDGNYLLTGKVYTKGIPLLKIDRQGSILAQGMYGGMGDSWEYGTIQETPDHGYILAGSITTALRTYDMYLVKFGPDQVPIGISTTATGIPVQGQESPGHSASPVSAGVSPHDTPEEPPHGIPGFAVHGGILAIAAFLLFVTRK